MDDGELWNESLIIICIFFTSHYIMYKSHSFQTLQLNKYELFIFRICDLLYLFRDSGSS